MVLAHAERRYHRDYKQPEALVDNGASEWRIDPNAPGMDDIRFVMSQNVEWLRPSDYLVGSFGIKEESGREHLLYWKISGERRDLRHGAIETEEPTEYAKSLFNSMFAGW